MRLLDHGGLLDDECLDKLERYLNMGPILTIVDHINDRNVQPDHYGRFFNLALRAKTLNTTHLMQRDMCLPLQRTDYEQMLRTAAEIGQVEVVTRLLQDQELDVNAADEISGSTALHQAAKTDQLEVTQILMDRGADWGKPDSAGRIGLHSSVQGRGVRCLQYLLHRGADTSYQDVEGMTVWHLAAEEGNVQALKMLLSESVDSASAISVTTNDGSTPLLFASANDSKEAVSLLISAGSSLTEPASDGSSSLHYAAEFGCLEVVQYLLAQAVDPSAVTQDGSNAIHCAIEAEGETLPDIVHALLENGVDPSKPRKNTSTPLHDLVSKIRKFDNSPYSYELAYLFATSLKLLQSLLEKSQSASDMQLGSELIYLACRSYFPSAQEIVLALLKLGLNPNNQFQNGETALMRAAATGNEASFSTLLLHGADPCIKDSDFLTALHYACRNDNRSILVLLRDTNIDWNGHAVTELCGERSIKVTALHIVALSERNGLLDYLIHENLVSNVNACTNRGVTPLYVAVWAQAGRNVSALLAMGADTTLLDARGTSVIHLAARWGDGFAIDQFIRHGSDLGLSNNVGLTPELLARYNGHTALADIIMEHVNEQSMFPRTLSMYFHWWLISLSGR